MQDHDFEKRVHLKMGELKVLPSEDVWEKVELRLNQKEERRRWILWLPLLLTALSLGSYGIWNKMNNSSQHKVRLPVHANNNNQPNKNDSSAITNNELTKADTNSGTGIHPGNKEHQPLNVATRNLSNKITKLNGTGERANGKTNTKQGVIVNSLLNKIPAGKLRVNNTSETIETLPQRNNVPKSTALESEIAGSRINETALVSHEGTKTLFPVSVNTSPIFIDSANTSLLFTRNDLNTSILKKIMQKKIRWEWGVSFQVGRSSVTTGSLNKIFGGAQMDYFSNASFAQPNNNVIAPGAFYKEPNPVKSAAGFSTGVFVKKHLSRTFAVSIGLNYTLYTISNRVGVKADSSMMLQSAFVNRRSLEQYYRLGSTDRYTNRYHYIEMPVLLQTRLIRTPKIPLHWDLGFSVSKLVASNALHFDNLSGVYYEDIQRLNKLQVNLITGLPIGLFPWKKYSLQVGPEFQYGLSNIFTPETNMEKHFFFLGLKANLQLGKK